MENGSPTGEPESTFDMTAAVDSIGADLFPPKPPDDSEEAEEAIAASPDATGPASSVSSPTEAAPVSSEPTVLEVPKSWKTEMHPYWSKLDPAVQKYYVEREKQMLDGLEQYKTEAQQAKTWREALTPYQQTLKQLGLDELTAAKSLFQADHILRYSPPEQKHAYFKRLAENYGIDLGTVGTIATVQSNGQPAQVDPTLKAIQDKLAAVESTLTARQQADLQAAQERTAKEVDAFASDKAHPHFDEVADDMPPFLKQGMSLQDAYERAVWANPVVREKQVQARLQTEAEKAKENARLTALPKQKAARANVRSFETKRTPTEPLGTMEDTMKETLREVRSRPAH